MPSYVRAGIRKCARIRALSFSDQIAANAIDEGVNAKAVAVQAKRQGFRLER